MGEFTMTQTMIHDQREVTTFSFYIPHKELDNENWIKYIPFQYLSKIQIQPIKTSQDGFYNHCKAIRYMPKLDPINERIASFFCLKNWDEDTPLTETIYNEKQEELFRYKPSNVIISKQVATKLRAREVTAFVPVSAADLIWVEALSMDNDSNE
jgi:hypothetical protein